MQAIERKVRTLKFSVEEVHGVRLTPNHPLLVWAVEYASQVTNRQHKYAGEGRTAFELRRGKAYRRPLPPFGEKVAAMVLGKKKQKNEYRTFDAIFVGLVERSDMVIVMSPQHGAQRVATVKRLPESQRKDGEMVMALRGLPWRPKPEDPMMDEVPVCVCLRNRWCHGRTCQTHQG